jgi:hypothetical protein
LAAGTSGQFLCGWVQVPDVTGIIDRLLLFLGYEKDYVTAETLVQVGRWRLPTLPASTLPASAEAGCLHALLLQHHCCCGRGACLV